MRTLTNVNGVSRVSRGILTRSILTGLSSAALAFLFAMALAPAVHAEEATTEATSTPTAGRFSDRLSLGVRGGWNSFLEFPFHEVNVDIKKSSGFIGGLELNYHLKDSVYAQLAVEYYDAPGDAEFDLTLMPIMLSVYAVFPVKSPVKPYVGGGFALYNVNGGEVRDTATTDARFNPGDDQLLDPEGDKWFSQKQALGMHMFVGLEGQVHERVKVFTEVYGRGFMPSRRFSTFHFPAYLGVRVKL